jgi:predicted Zn-dependent protease
MADERDFNPHSRESALDFLEHVLKLSKASQTEVTLEAESNALTRFAGNQIHQNMGSSDCRLSVRAIEGEGIGDASTNKFDAESLRQTLDSARQVARSGRIPAEPPDLPEPQRYREIQNFFEATAQFSPAQRAEMAKRIIEASSEHGAEAAGAVSNSAEALAIANSRGLRAFHSLTDSHFTATVLADGSTGWCDCASADVASLDTEERGKQALERALAARKPRKLEPGKYTVILEEPAVKEFLDFLAWLGFGAQSFEEGRSFMCGKIGTKITGENITIVDDAFHPMGGGVPFDYEGMPKQRVVLIENGVARGVVHDRASAARMGVSSTGHALPSAYTYGPLPMNLVMGPGTHSFQDMLRSIERGLLITRFWYCRVVDPAKTLLTGQTRDGTFLIENGELVCGVNDMRFNVSVLECFARADMVNNALRRVNSTLVPSIKTADFQFTEVVGES